MFCHMATLSHLAEFTEQELRHKDEDSDTFPVHNLSIASPTDVYIYEQNML